MPDARRTASNAPARRLACALPILLVTAGCSGAVKQQVTPLPPPPEAAKASPRRESAGSGAGRAKPARRRAAERAPGVERGHRTPQPNSPQPNSPQPNSHLRKKPNTPKSATQQPTPVRAAAKSAEAPSAPGPALGGPPLVAMDGQAAPGWIRWLGWSRGSDHIAWRYGAPGTRNRRGAPVWIARVGPDGRVLERRLASTSPRRTLRSMGVRPRAQLLRERITPRDVILGARDGRRIVVVLRKDPLVVALVQRDGARYAVHGRAAVERHARYVRAAGYLSPDRRLVAVVAHTGTGDNQQGTLWVLPLRAHAAGRGADQSRLGKRALR